MGIIVIEKLAKVWSTFCRSRKWKAITVDIDWNIVGGLGSFFLEWCAIAEHRKTHSIAVRERGGERERVDRKKFRYNIFAVWKCRRIGNGSAVDDNAVANGTCNLAIKLPNENPIRLRIYGFDIGQLLDGRPRGSLICRQLLQQTNNNVLINNPCEMEILLFGANN